MDLVLGLSVTSTAVRWVLVEGVTGDGDAVDRGALDIVDGWNSTLTPCSRCCWTPTRRSSRTACTPSA